MCARCWSIVLSLFVALSLFAFVSCNSALADVDVDISVGLGIPMPPPPPPPPYFWWAGSYGVAGGVDVTYYSPGFWSVSVDSYGYMAPYVPCAPIWYMAPVGPTVIVGAGFAWVSNPYWYHNNGVVIWGPHYGPPPPGPYWGPHGYPPHWPGPGPHFWPGPYYGPHPYPGPHNWPGPHPGPHNWPGPHRGPAPRPVWHGGGNGGGHGGGHGGGGDQKMFINKR